MRLLMRQEWPLGPNRAYRVGEAVEVDDALGARILAAGAATETGPRPPAAAMSNASLRQPAAKGAKRAAKGIGRAAEGIGRARRRSR